MKTTAVRLAVLVLTLAAGTLLACSSGGPALTDEQVSLRPEGLLQLTAPPPTQFVLAEPGDSTLLPRGGFGAPPMIPHAVEDVELSADANDCLDCHEVSDEETPGVPNSHQLKAVFELRPHGQAVEGSLTVFRGFVQAKPVAGQRYNCVLCHAPQATNATPLVGNAYPVAEPKDAAPDSLEGLKAGEGSF